MGINQKIVLDIVSKCEPVSLADIKGLVSKQSHTIKNVKKVVNSLLKGGYIHFAAGLYSASTKTPPVHTKKTSKFAKAIAAGYTIGKPLSYPKNIADGIIDDSAIIDYLVNEEKLTKTTRSSIGFLVDLTEENSKIVEKQIPLGIVGKGRYTLAKRYLPTAYILYMSLCPGGIPAMFSFTNRSHVVSVVKQIDSDNGTLDHKNHHDSAINSFSDFIVNPANDFLLKLNGTIKDIKQLVADLKASCTAYNANSLASKVCKYFHEYRYGHDKFFINDSVVRSVLPYYLDAYGIKHGLSNAKQFDALSYSDLYDLLDALYSKIPPFKCGRAMTKTEFDHILWYCYRNYHIK